LCNGIYEITKHYPKEEKFNLVKHLRESGRGVMGNIAEGFGRYFYKSSMQFYDIDRGCLHEVKSDIYLSYDQKYINKKIFEKFLDQIKLINVKPGGLIKQSKNQLNAKNL
jgi:four helix bundle protein